MAISLNRQSRLALLRNETKQTNLTGAKKVQKCGMDAATSRHIPTRIPNYALQALKISLASLHSRTKANFETIKQSSTQRKITVTATVPKRVRCILRSGNQIRSNVGFLQQNAC
jgi:hypothetical protein